MKALKMRSHQSPGKLITFCGLDGCGKTTMINYLYTYLTELGYDVLLTKQPSDFIRQLDIFRTFMDCEETERYDYRSLSLLAAGDRIQHSNRVILPALENGKIVLSDRYYYSCLANLRARGYQNDRWIYEIARFIPRPDIAFFLDVDVEIATKRIRQRENEKENWIDIHFQNRLCLEYRQMSKYRRGILVDSSKTPDETFNIIKGKVNELFLKGR